MDNNDMDHRLTVIEGKVEANINRITAVEKRQSNFEKLVSTVEVLVNREKNMEDDVKEIKQDVKALTEKPSKKWDTITTSVITCILSLVLGFLFAYMTNK